MDATEDGDVLLVGWHETTPGGSTEMRVSGAIRANNSLPTSQIYTYAAFGGCDIAADIAGGSTYQGGFVVWCADDGSGRLNLYARHVAFAGAFGAAFPLTAAAAGEGARNPSICADSSVNADRYGGMLVAWDWEYLDVQPTPPISRHFIQTNKFEYLTAGSGTIRWSWSVIDVNRSYPSLQSYHPDIARISKQGDGLDTLGFIVWEDMLELCSPSRQTEIHGNWIVYDTIPPTPHIKGSQWSVPKLIGPGTGLYSQTEPMVKTSVGKTVNVFWLDNRSGFDMVNGTRVWAEGTDGIFWAKDVAEKPEVVPGTLRLGESWPNPLTLRHGGILQISLDVDAESTIRLSIFDNLGREVAMVHEGALPIGRHILRFDASMLQPGIYHYVLRGADMLSSRGLVIVR
jgi:hypothetical protein